MKPKFLNAFMDTAHRFAQLSTARRAKVGAIIVKDSRIISIGYNGMPAGWDNNCEHEDWPDWIENNPKALRDPVYLRLHTKDEVLHAETNAIAKVARSAESCEGATMFCTHLPCIQCAKLIYQSGIECVYYDNDYHSAVGVGKEFLLRSGVRTIHWPTDKNTEKSIA